jgi:amino acid transporter
MDDSQVDEDTNQEFVEDHPERGLAVGSLTVTEAVFQGVAGMFPSASVGFGMTLLFLVAGTASWLSMTIALVIILFVGFPISQIAKRVAGAGGFYLYITRAFGPAAGFIGGMLLWFGYVVLGASNIVFSPITLSGLTLGTVGPGTWWFTPLAWAVTGLIPLALAIAGIRLSARTSVIAEFVTIAGILVLYVLTFIHVGHLGSPQQASLEGASISGIVTGIILSIYLFIGFEGAAALGAEGKNPLKSIPLSILVSTIGIGLFYVLSSYMVVLGLLNNGADFSVVATDGPLYALAKAIGLEALGVVLTIGILASNLIGMLVFYNSGARMILSMAGDGFLPKVLERTLRKQKTPAVALITMVVFVYLIAGLALVGQSDVPTATGYLATIGTLGVILAYGLVCLGAPFFIRRKDGRVSPLVVVISFIGGLGMLLVFITNWLPFPPFPPLDAPYSWFAYVVFAWILGLLIYFAIRRRIVPTDLTPNAGSVTD